MNGTEVYINFIDFQKAFDSVHRESLWSILLAEDRRSEEYTHQVELKISPNKTEVLPVNISAPLLINIGQLRVTLQLPNNSLIYLVWSVVKGELTWTFNSKAGGAFIKLLPVWRSRKHRRSTKIKIYQSCVLSVSPTMSSSN